jgi:hypothetical protein
MPKKDYSHLPPALRPKSKKVKEKQRAQAQRVRSKAAQTKARKTSKAKDKWGNVKQAVQDVRSSDAVALGAMVLGRGRGKGGGVKLPKFKRLELPKAPRIAKAKTAAKKSPARKKAEKDLKTAEFNRKTVKRMANEDAQRLGRSPKKRAKELRQTARRTESLDRKYPVKGDASLRRSAADARRVAKKIEAGKGMDKSAMRVSKEVRSQFIKKSNKKLVQARKAVKRAQTTGSTPVKPRAKAKKAPAKKAPRITKAKAAAKARVTQAKGRLKVAKEGRASEKKAKAEARTKILQTAGKKTRRSRHLTRKSSPGTKKAAERLLQDNLKVQRVVEKGRASSASTRKALRGHDAKDPLHKAFGGQQSKRDASGGRRVVSAKKALKRAQTTASTPVKPRAKAKRGKR